MCGIAGRFSWAPPPDPATVARMRERLAHRGPEAAGLHADGPMAMGHRRLKIIDTSDAANQPMFDHSGRYVLTFNGEIYNYRELRKELEAAGGSFTNQSDTEVILEAYKAWGTDCVARFNGMFAFALWDQTDQTLFLVRDRLGKKPLFYAKAPGGGVIFASELKGLVEDPDVSRALDPTALGHYLSQGYTLTDRPIFHGLHKLPPAHCLLIKRGGEPRTWSYWDLADAFRHKSTLSADQAAEELHDLLLDAVRLRLISDVPLGSFLSGGLDSSTIVALMCALRPAEQNNCFSMGFSEKGYSELDEAHTVADHLGVAFHGEVLPEISGEHLAEFFHAGDEPFADTSLIPMREVAGQARRRVTVCLSGDGGDEIFGGYQTYVADRLRHLTGWIPGPVSGLALKAFNAAVPASHGKVALDYKIRQFLQGHALPYDRAHMHWRALFDREQKKQLLRPEFHDAVAEADPFDHIAPIFDEVRDLHYLDQAMYVDIKTWLVEDILVKIDRATMAHSLEGRCPFLDHRVVEFAASLPVNFKTRGLATKWLLKRMAEPLLPRRIVHRKKAGFNCPVGHWFAKSTLLEDIGFEALSCGLMQPDYIARLASEHREGRADHSYRLQAILALYHWMELYQPEGIA